MRAERGSIPVVVKYLHNIYATRSIPGLFEDTLTTLFCMRQGVARSHSEGLCPGTAYKSQRVPCLMSLLVSETLQMSWLDRTRLLKWNVNARLFDLVRCWL